MKEIEEGGRNYEQNEQASVLSTLKKRDERQMSVSPILIMSQNARAYHNEQGGGSWQKSRNA